MDMKQSLRLRIKKNLYSKGADSTAARKVIIHYLGDEAEVLLAGIQRVAEVAGGEEKGQELISLVYKFALKGKVYADEGILTMENTLYAHDSVIFLCRKFQEASETPVEEVKEKQELIPYIGAVFSRVGSIIVDMVEPHMSQGNLEKLDGLLRYLGSEQFLTTLITDDEVAEEKAIIAENMAALLQHVQHYY